MTTNVANIQPSLGTKIRALFLRLHFYVGIFIGPFILIAAITGALYAMGPTITKVVYHKYLYSQSSVSANASANTLSKQIVEAQKYAPDRKLKAVQPGFDGKNTIVFFGAQPGKTMADSTRYGVFVDPSNMNVIGGQNIYGSSNSFPFQTWVDGLHRTLHLGTWGRWYSELAASWLWVLALSGVFLWIKRQKNRGRMLRLPKNFFSKDSQIQGRKRTLSWHATTGFWVILVMLFLSATGMTWSQYAGNHIDQLRAALNWTTPSISSGSNTGTQNLPVVSSESLATQTADSYKTALNNGLTGPVEVKVPSKDSTDFVATQVRLPGVWSSDSMSINPQSNKITSFLPFSSWPIAAKLSFIGIGLHMGVTGGLINQIILLVVALIIVGLIVRGYRMWWQRGSARQSIKLLKWNFGSLPGRGVSTQVPFPVLVLLILVSAFLSWFIPLLGISLIFFLVIDATISIFQASKSVDSADISTKLIAN